jgi:hypothetical protein
VTELEQIALGHLVQAWNAFLCLPTEHSDDIDEFRHGIHALQKQIMARPTRREMKRPLSIQERTDAAVKAERERSERLNPNHESPRKAAEAVTERTAKSDANSSQEASESAKSAGEVTGTHLPTNSPATANEMVGGFPVAAAPYHAEETGVIASTRQGARIESRIEPGLTVVGTESGTVINSVNERCGNPDHCKFSHHPHKITCPSCNSAWAAKMKTAVAA